MKKYQFKSKLWKYKGPTGWHFLTLPKTLSRSIRKYHLLSEEGWGRLPTVASIGNTQWKTAIWYDTKVGSYLLPVKSAVRKARKIEAGATVSVKLAVQELEKRMATLMNNHNRSRLKRL